MSPSVTRHSYTYRLRVRRLIIAAMLINWEMAVHGRFLERFWRQATDLHDLKIFGFKTKNLTRHSQQYVTRQVSSELYISLLVDRALDG